MIKTEPPLLGAQISPLVRGTKIPHALRHKKKKKGKKKDRKERKKSGTSGSGQISLFRIESHDRHSERVVCKPESLFYDWWWKMIKTPDHACHVGWEHILAPQGRPQRPPVSVWLECSHVHWFLYVCDCFVMQWESWGVAMGMTWPAELKIPTFQPFTESLLTPAPGEGFLGGCCLHDLPYHWHTSPPSVGAPAELWGWELDCLLPDLTAAASYLCVTSPFIIPRWALGRSRGHEKTFSHTQWHINRPAGSGAGWAGKSTALICYSPWPFQDNLEPNLGRVIVVTHLIPGRGRSPGEGNGNPLQYSCLENPMEGGAW